MQISSSYATNYAEKSFFRQNEQQIYPECLFEEQS